MYPCQNVPIIVFDNRCYKPCLYCGLYEYKFSEEKIIASGVDDVIKEMSKYRGAYLSPVTDCFLPGNREITHNLLKETWKLNPKWVSLVNTKQIIPSKTIELLIENKNSVVLQISLPSINEEMISILEPGSAPVTKRIEMIGTLIDRGLRVIVVAMPWFGFDEPEKFAQKIAEVNVRKVIISNGILTKRQMLRMINSGNEKIKKIAESVCIVKEATNNGYVLPKIQRVKSLNDFCFSVERFGIKCKVCISDNHDLGDTSLPLCGEFVHKNFN